VRAEFQDHAPAAGAKPRVARSLIEQMERHHVTHLQCTPSFARLLAGSPETLTALKSLRLLLVGGEALPVGLAAQLTSELPAPVINMYGPTETTIWSSCVRITAGDAPVTVGGPIANTQFYVLDRNDQPLPSGVPGELHIGGDGVARGYYKRAQLTDEKFLANPFTTGRMYRTGDLARWLPNGGVQVLGRIDHQIKLRGFRIELGEIESVLSRKAPVAAAAVVLREDMPGTPRLVAYYVEANGAQLSPEGLRALLAEEMPEYMIPAAWVRMQALPLSPNGKLDRTALPMPELGHNAKEEYAAPTTASELALTKIFAEVMHLDRVGVNADLLKLGADSIQLFQITARANRAGIKITAKQLLQLRNAKALGALADAAVPEGTTTAAGTVLPTLGQFQRNRRAGSSARR
jgi:acyl-coenzyme A synthetase/AMP-(fatty) acid ligase/aryl carrier-like protein